MGSLEMALFIAERAYDLFLASAPGGVYACLSGIAVWTSTPLDTPGPVVPLSAARKSVDTVSRMQDQRPQAVPTRLPALLLPAKSGWRRYRAAETGRWASW